MQLWLLCSDSDVTPVQSYAGLHQTPILVLWTNRTLILACSLVLAHGWIMPSTLGNIFLVLYVSMLPTTQVKIHKIFHIQMFHSLPYALLLLYMNPPCMPMLPSLNISIIWS